MKSKIRLPKNERDEPIFVPWIKANDYILGYKVPMSVIMMAKKERIKGILAFNDEIDKAVDSLYRMYISPFDHERDLSGETALFKGFESFFKDDLKQYRLKNGEKLTHLIEFYKDRMTIERANEGIWDPISRTKAPETVGQFIEVWHLATGVELTMSDFALNKLEEAEE